MAKTSIALAELVEQGARDDFVRDRLAHVVRRMMDFEIEQRCDAEYGERSDDRTNSRNGYRERLWEARAGSIDLKIRSCAAAAEPLPGLPSRAPREGR